MSIIAQDSYTRADAADWGTADAGGSWSRVVGSDDDSIVSNTGRITQVAALTDTVYRLGSGTTTKLSILVRFSIGAQNCGPVWGYQDSDNFYRAVIEGGWFYVQRRNGGSFTTLASVFFGSPTVYDLLIEMDEAGNISGSVWDHSGSPPESPQISVNDPSPLGGGFGVTSVGNVTSSFNTFYYFEVDDLTAAVVEASTTGRSIFKLSAAQQTTGISRFLTSSRLLSGSRDVFQVRSAQTVRGRGRFLLRAEQTTSSMAVFQARAAQTTQGRANLNIRSAQMLQSRVRMVVRAAQATTARSRFLISGLYTLVSQSRSVFKTRAVQISQSRARFLIPTHALTAPLRLVFSLIQQISLSFGLAQQLSCTFSMQEALPHTTIVSSNTVKDASNVALTNLSAATVLVTFPDESTQSFSLAGDTVSNDGSGVYSITYATKGPGLIKEKWDVTAADGTTQAEDLNWIEVRY